MNLGNTWKLLAAPTKMTALIVMQDCICLQVPAPMHRTAFHVSWVSTLLRGLLHVKTASLDGSTTCLPLFRARCAMLVGIPLKQLQLAFDARPDSQTMTVTRQQTALYVRRVHTRRQVEAESTAATHVPEEPSITTSMSDAVLRHRVPHALVEGFKILQVKSSAMPVLPARTKLCRSRQCAKNVPQARTAYRSGVIPVLTVLTARRGVFRAPGQVRIQVTALNALRAPMLAMAVASVHRVNLVLLT